MLTHVYNTSPAQQRAGEVLPNGTKAKQEALNACWISESAHAPLAFPRGLATILGPIVHAGSRFEDMLDANQGLAIV